MDDAKTMRSMARVHRNIFAASCHRSSDHVNSPFLPCDRRRHLHISTCPSSVITAALRRHKSFTVPIRSVEYRPCGPRPYDVSVLLSHRLAKGRRAAGASGMAETSSCAFTKQNWGQPGFTAHRTAECRSGSPIRRSRRSDCQRMLVAIVDLDDCNCAMSPLKEVLDPRHTSAT